MSRPLDEKLRAQFDSKRGEEQAEKIARARRAAEAEANPKLSEIMLAEDGKTILAYDDPSMNAKVWDGPEVGLLAGLEGVLGALWGGTYNDNIQGKYGWSSVDNAGELIANASISGAPPLPGQRLSVVEEFDKASPVMERVMRDADAIRFDYGGRFEERSTELRGEFETARSDTPTPDGSSFAPDHTHTVDHDHMDFTA